MARELRLRRAGSLVCFWDAGQLVLHNYLTNTQTSVDPLVLALLGELDEPTPVGAVCARLGLGEAGAAVVDRLLAQDVLVAHGSALAQRDESLRERWTWGHDARYVHFGTQQLRFEYDAEAEEERLTQLARVEPPPSPYKNYAKSGLPLPQTFEERQGGLWEALRRRRTRRVFRRDPISLRELATVLQWTWGRTRELESPLLGRSILKTSPSGGARHAVEVYAVCLRVEDVTPGIYHYSVARHDLEPLRAGDFEELVVELCGAQGWMQDAAAVFFMTAVVERSMWKYRHSHAYRVLHLDAGHLGQTFHLVCTELGLAPFTTTATNAAGIEAALGVDGISELLLYTAATGYPADSAP